MFAERLDRPASPILKFYAYSATTSVGFYTPVLYVLFLSRGLSYTDIALVESVFMLTTIVGEIPTGWIGDRIGWRRSMLLANGLIATTVAGMAFASSVWAFAALHVSWSLGYNFRSGSEDAWLYEAVRRERDDDEFAGIRGRAESVGLVVGTVSALAGGTLADTSLAWPFFAAAGITLLGIPLILSLPTVETKRDDTFSHREAIDVVRSLFETPGLRKFVLFVLVVTYLVAAASVFIQPLAMGQGFDERGLGVLYAGFKLTSAGASYVVDDVRERLGDRTVFLAGPLVIGAAFVVTLAVPVFVIPAFFLIGGVRSVLRPVGYQKINDGLSAVGRATALSGIAMVGSLIGIGAKFGAGRVADVTSPQAALVAVGVTALAVFAVVSATGTGLRADGEAVAVDGPIVRDDATGSSTNDD